MCLWNNQKKMHECFIFRTELTVWLWTIKCESQSYCTIGFCVLPSDKQRSCCQRFVIIAVVVISTAAYVIVRLLFSLSSPYQDNAVCVSPMRVMHVLYSVPICPCAHLSLWLTVITCSLWGNRHPLGPDMQSRCMRACVDVNKMGLTERLNGLV